MSYFGNNNYYKGDMVFIKNDKYYGTEYGNGADRPALVVSADKFNNDPSNPFVVICYMTTKPKDFVACHVPVMCLQPSTCLCESVTKISKDRIGSFIRTATEVEMKEVDKALRYVFDMDGIKEATEPKKEATDVYKNLYFNLLAKAIESGVAI